jgi:hypothetical protein
MSLRWPTSMVSVRSLFRRTLLSTDGRSALLRRRCVCVPALLRPVVRESAGSGALARVGAGAEDQDALYPFNNDFSGLDHAYVTGEMRTQR